MVEFHMSPYSEHLGTWVTFEKLKEKYLCPGMYADMQNFVSTYESYQVYIGIRHRDSLHPTYPLPIQIKWMVDLVTMLMGVGQMRYSVLA